jgi:hypothetical protein
VLRILVVDDTLQLPAEVAHQIRIGGIHTIVFFPLRNVMR